MSASRLLFGRGTSSYYGYEQKLGSGGWELTSGKQAYRTHDGADWAYAGSGTHSRTIAVGTLSGTIEEGGGQGYQNETTAGAVVASGVWVHAGSDSQESHSSESYSYSGSGTYTYSVAGGAVNGKMWEGGGHSHTRNQHLQGVRAADGTYARSGSAGGGGYTSSDFGYAGSGTYSYNVTGGAMSGTIIEGGGYGGGNSYGYASEWTAAGWQQTSGSWSNASHDTATWSYTGSGSYSRPVAGGSLDGTVSEGGGAGHTYTWTTSGTRQADGSWLATGSGISGHDNERHYSYAGSGSSTTRSR